MNTIDFESQKVYEALIVSILINYGAIPFNNNRLWGQTKKYHVDRP